MYWRPVPNSATHAAGVTAATLKAIGDIGAAERRSPASASPATVPVDRDAPKALARAYRLGGSSGAYFASASGTSAYDGLPKSGPSCFVEKNSQALVDNVITRSATAALRVGYILSSRLMSVVLRAMPLPGRRRHPLR